jgi:F0F1-type ATP synthase assembly protein I
MPAPRLEKLIWLLIYGGLLTLCLGIFLQRRHGGWGWTFISGGGAAALAGVILIGVRSRWD